MFPSDGTQGENVQEFTGPGERSIDPDDNAIAAFFAIAKDHPSRTALAYREGDAFVDMPVGKLAEEVRAIAKGFIGLGIEPGSRILIHCRTRIEFTFIDFAIWAAGCVTVPIYDTSSTEQIEWIASNSAAVMMISETPDMAAAFEAGRHLAPTVKHAYVIDEGGLDAIREAGSGVADEAIEERVAAITHSDLATLVYTSGTTGNPKGCELTHYNFIWSVRQATAHLPELFVEGASTIMFLPLAHIFARVVQVACVATGVRLGYSTGIPQLVEELGMFKPTWLFSVPRVFEKVYNASAQRAHADGKGKIFDRAAQVAINYSEAEQRGSAGLALKVQHRIFDALVYSKLRGALGGEVKHAISGAAALGERLGHFYNGIGVMVLEGYGLTETTAGATVNTVPHRKIGTVGRPIAGCTIKIADDGEILIKGGNVMLGYYENEAATSEAIDSDGFFHSGDIGELDDDGFLRITGRKKEIIVTAAGKNVAPAVLEDRIRAHALVSQCMVVGDGQKFISALVTIDEDHFPHWAEAMEKSGSVSDLIDDHDLRAAIGAAIEDANGAVSRAESIREYRILPSDFSIESGEMTPSLKVRRMVVAEKYKDVISSIYAE